MVADGNKLTMNTIQGGCYPRSCGTRPGTIQLVSETIHVPTCCDPTGRTDWPLGGAERWVPEPRQLPRREESAYRPGMVEKA